VSPDRDARCHFRCRVGDDDDSIHITFKPDDGSAAPGATPAPEDPTRLQASQPAAAAGTAARAANGFPRPIEDVSGQDFWGRPRGVTPPAEGVVQIPIEGIPDKVRSKLELTDVRMYARCTCLRHLSSHGSAVSSPVMLMCRLAQRIISFHIVCRRGAHSRRPCICRPRSSSRPPPPQPTAALRSQCRHLQMRRSSPRRRTLHLPWHWTMRKAPLPATATTWAARAKRSTYSPMAAAIEAGRKVSRLYVHIREGWHWLNSLLQPLCERGCESRQRCVTFLHSCVASYGWRAQYLLLMQCAAQAPLLTAAHTSPSCCVTDAQARVAVSQASIDELAAEINAETSEEPKTPDEVQQHPHCAAAGIGESLDVIVPSKPCVKPGGSCR